MKKLLSLVLSVSLLFSSVTPSLGQAISGRAASKAGRAARGATQHSIPSSALTRRVFTQKALASSPLRSRILSGKISGLSAEILRKPLQERVPLMRREFVTLSLMQGGVSPAERIQALAHYRQQLTSFPTFEFPKVGLADLLKATPQSPAGQAVEQARGAMADAAALSLVVPHEGAPTLLNFYQQAKGTAFDDTALLITARGLLRIEAYDQLGSFLATHSDRAALAGLAQYIVAHDLPVVVPASLTHAVSPATNEQMAAFLEKDFALNTLHADPSLQATEEWMDMSQLSIQPEAASMPQTQTSAPQAKTSVPQTEAPAFSGITLLPPAPGSFVRPVHENVLMDNATASTQTSVQTLQPQAHPVSSSAPRQHAQPTQVSSAGSGILYGGIPFFAMMNSAKRAITWLRSLGKKKDRPAPYEEPGLHENTARPVYENGSVPEIMWDEELSTADEVNEREVMVGVKGFKLSITKEDGAEHVLQNVELTLSGSVKGFDPIYNRLTLDSKNIFELRNETLKAERPDHFYFVLKLGNGELPIFLDGASKIGLSRPLRIKIQRSSSPSKVVTLPIYKTTANGKAERTEVSAEVDLRLLPVGKDLAEMGLIIADGDALYFRNQEGELTALENSYVRLPKEESKYWTKILAMNEQTPFSIGVFSTKDKMPPLTYLVPALQIGLGKTLAPVLEEYTNLSETAASYTMMGINNGLPALMAFVNPLLNRFGEAQVYRAGVASLVVAGLGAIASGLYGHIGSSMSPLQLAAFLTSSTFLAFGVSVTRYLQGLLIKANRGIVREGSSFVNNKTEGKAEINYNTKHLVKRVKEVFTKKGEKSLMDVLNLQKAAMFKNLGTAIFLAYPWLANLTGSLFGVDLGLDFSASYIPYSLFSLYTLYKVGKTPFKNSFPLDISTLRNNLADVQNQVLHDVAKIGSEPTTIIKTRQRSGSELLKDAYFLSRFGTPEQAPVLLDVYNRLKDSSYNNEIVFHAARGLLRMGAYNELQVILSENPQNAMLSGIAAYIKEQNLPVEVPQGMTQLVVPETSDEFNVLDYLDIIVDLDASLQGIKEWVSREPNREEKDKFSIWSFSLNVEDLGNPIEETRITETMEGRVKTMAEDMNNAIGRLVSAESRKSKKAPKDFTREHETEFGDALEEYLLKAGRTAEEAQQIRQAFRDAFDKLNHRNINLKDIALKVGLPTSLTAMAIATMGELGFSNNFAFLMRGLVGDATAATAIVGLLLYGSMFSWRVVGNLLVPRMSGGSMYAISSAAAVLGSAAMAMFPDNMPLVMAGASIGCFGISNFFAQMYDYIIDLHPEYKREVALLINLTMPIAALGAPLFRLAGHIPGLDMALVSAAMAGSVALTPKMLAGSSILRVLGNDWKKIKARVQSILGRHNDGDDQPPLIESPAQ